MRAIIAFGFAVIAMFAASWWVQASAARYLSLRRERLSESLPTDQVLERYTRAPWRWPLEMGRVWRQLYAWETKQDPDPIVDAARQTYERRQRLSLYVYIVAIVGVLVVASIHGP